MRLISIVIFILILIKSVDGQTSLTFIEVDTTTYRAYLNEDWDGIIEMGNNAIANDIDYYYLRMRMAYAFFMKERYRMAISHYKKALVFVKNDAIAFDYLYYSYRYSARDNDAEKLVGRFTPEDKKDFQKKYSKKITDVGFYSTFGTGAEGSVKDDVSLTAPQSIEGSQIVPNSYLNFNVSLGHRIGHSILIHHAGNLLYKDEYAFAVVNSISYLSESQVIRQFNYLLEADITPFEGLTFTPVFSYINYRVPIFYEYGVGSRKNRQVYTYDTHTETAFGLKVRKQLGIFALAVTGTHSDLNLSQQNTGTASFSVYPFGNLNLYYTANGYLHIQKQHDEAIQQIIQFHEIGFKIVEHLWVEGYTMIGPFSNLYDSYSGIVYNSLELYKNISAINFIVPFYKSGISLFIGYRHYQSESSFIPVKNVFEHYNSKIFNYQSITGGLTWKR